MCGSCLTMPACICLHSLPNSYFANEHSMMGVWQPLWNLEDHALAVIDDHFYRVFYKPNTFQHSGDFGQRRAGFLALAIPVEWQKMQLFPMCRTPGFQGQGAVTDYSFLVPCGQYCVSLWILKHLITVITMIFQADEWFPSSLKNYALKA